MKFLYPVIDFVKTQIQNFRLHNLSSAPDGVEGMLYADTTDHVPKYHNGTSWIDLGGGATIAEADNPALTASSGVCTWTFTHNLGRLYPIVQLYEISTKEQILCDITAVSTTACTITIKSDTNIAAGVYHVAAV